jgi:hypothetical protein
MKNEVVKYLVNIHLVKLDLLKGIQVAREGTVKNNSPKFYVHDNIP